MSMFIIDLNGIKGLREYMKNAPDATLAACRDAINGAIRFAYAESSREIRKQVNLTQDYIGSVAQGNRLKVSGYATIDNLVASITARRRAVSLARYALDRSLGKRPGGVKVMVKPGRIENLPGGFMLPLRAGDRPITDDDFNLGLAVRLRPGQNPGTKHTMVRYSKTIRSGRTKIDADLYLLYGPSVDQVFNQVRVIVEPAVMQWLTQEFFRQFQRHAA